MTQALPLSSEVVHHGTFYATRSEVVPQGRCDGGRMRSGPLTGVAGGLCLIVVLGACGSSTAPPALGAKLAGSWLDTADYYDELNALTVTLHGDSVQIVSPRYFVSFRYNGVRWFSREGQIASATGVVTRDSVAVCDAGLGGSCPNEIGYLRDSSFVLYLGPFGGGMWDTAGLGYTFSRGTWSTADTIAPADAPPPIAISSVWVSDSMAWSGTCPGVVQIGVALGSPIDADPPPTLFQLDDPLSYGQSWVRQCSSTTWAAQSGYLGSSEPTPCTPADFCIISLLDTALSQDTTDSWFFMVGGEDSLVDETPTFINSGWLPAYFLRDSGATSLARIRGVRPPPASTIVRRQSPLVAFREARRANRMARAFRPPDMKARGWGR